MKRKEKKQKHMKSKQAADSNLNKVQEEKALTT